MVRAVVGRWGNNLAVRVPLEVARASGLTDGERVEIEVQDGDLLIRRAEARARASREVQAAAAEIVADSKRHALGDVTIRELLDEGRRIRSADRLDAVAKDVAPPPIRYCARDRAAGLNRGQPVEASAGDRI